MEVGDKLKELNMSVDEVEMLTKAFQDEKFREMLRGYAQEISDPENKKRYEEEIKILEQQRGNTIEFIHPEPFKALRTIVNGKQKCFINICANEKVGKPANTLGVSEEGRRGQCWSLPHSLHPGRQDTGPKGNKIMIYDVIFHPDALHIASKNKRFMDLVDSTAIQGIQSAFNVTLDKNNVREMSSKYKGTPQPCVIRKPMPGYQAKETPGKPDPLAFPYPDDKRPTTSLQTNPTDSPVTKINSGAETKNFKIQPQKTKVPTKPNHTVKYRSYIDIQDFRCSRDSARSPRPKEIVVTIDVPLLKAVTDASLEVEKRRLLLESKKPAYRLELPLAYPVDEDKGEAKFNKQRGQLVVTLPVLPSNKAFDFTVRPAQTSITDDEMKGEKIEAEAEDTWKEKESEGLGNKAEEERHTEEEDLKQQTRVGKDEEEDKRRDEQIREEENSKGEEGTGAKEDAKRKKEIHKGSVEEEKLKEQRQENEKDIGKLNPQKRQKDEDKLASKSNKLREVKCHRAAEKRDSGVTSFQCDTVDQRTDVSAEEISCVASPGTENQPAFAEPPSYIGNLNSCSESTSSFKQAKETPVGNLKVETDAAFLLSRSNKAVSSIPADTQSQNNPEDCSIPQGTVEPSKLPATVEANASSRGDAGNRVALCSEDRGTSSVKQERRNIDGDDLSTEQIFQTPGHDNKPPPAILREIDEDGHEKIISDHSTSAGFIFQNSLMYELD